MRLAVGCVGVEKKDVPNPLLAEPPSATAQCRAVPFVLIDRLSPRPEAKAARFTDCSNQWGKHPWTSTNAPLPMRGRSPTLLCASLFSVPTLTGRHANEALRWFCEK